MIGPLPLSLVSWSHRRGLEGRLGNLRVAQSRNQGPSFSSSAAGPEQAHWEAVEAACKGWLPAKAAP